MAEKYREKYKRHYGIEFGKNYVIHHIDEDRTNNDISNLILLPHVLHSKYHHCKTMMLFQMQNGFAFNLSYSASCVRSLQFSHLDEFREVLKEIQVWIERKHLADMGHDAYSMFEKR